MVITFWSSLRWISFQMTIHAINTQERRSLRTRTFETWLHCPIRSSLFSIINHVTRIQDLPYFFTSKLLDIFFSLSSAFNLLIFHNNLYALQAPLLHYASCGFTSKTSRTAAPTFCFHDFLKSSIIGTARRSHREEGGMKSNARLMVVQPPTELKNEKTAF